MTPVSVSSAARLITVLASKKNRYRDRNGTVWQDFSESTDWTPSNMSTCEADAENVKTGTASLRVVPATDGNSYISRNINVRFQGNERAYMWVYLPDGTASPDSVRLRLHPAPGDWSHFYTIAGQSGRTVGNLRPGWNLLKFNFADATTFGSPSWSSPMAIMRLYVVRTGSPTALTLDGLYLGGYQRAKAIVTFDDGHESLYNTAFPIMQAYGLTGTSYVSKDHTLNGVPGYMTLAQHHAMYEAGWDIANHAVTHQDISLLEDKGEVEAELLVAQTWLESEGFTRRNSHLHFAPPYGTSSTLMREVITEAGMLTVRGTFPGYEWPQPIYPAAMPMLCMQIPKPLETSLDAAKAWIDYAIAWGGTVIFLFHWVEDAPVETISWQTDRFAGLMAYLAQQRKRIDTIPISQWYEGVMARWV